MHVKRFADAKPYDAPNHRNYASLRLFGDEALGTAGLGSEQAQRGVVAVIGRVVGFGISKTFDVHENLLPRSDEVRS